MKRRIQFIHTYYEQHRVHSYTVIYKRNRRHKCQDTFNKRTKVAAFRTMVRLYKFI